MSESNEAKETQKEQLEDDRTNENEVKVDQADFGELNTIEKEVSDHKIDMLLEVELDVTIELGRKRMTIQEVLQLGKGSIIELSKLAGEPVDIFVNQKKLAQGEVVVVDENFAIRITNLIEKSERLKSLGK
ncbi:MAG: flagellar motor switch protein FliN [Candidatus Neomarinimicrobiota bacterium]|jgi:flagellar motor switch protein FliN/FliY|nr:flagellar motor switch protein FliN [Candidatus Neomarinimicrobiota bacterium]